MYDVQFHYYRIMPISGVVRLFQTDAHSQEEVAKRSHEQSVDTIYI